MPERRPQPDGVLDPRLGISNKRTKCETCGLSLQDCTGHFGYIKLELPVFHIGYFKATLHMLQCICKSCSRVLLTEDERRTFLKRLRSPRVERVQREAIFRKLLERCKRVRCCPHCGEENGVVKKAPGSLKIIHDPYHKKPDKMATYHAEFQEACATNEGIRINLNKVVDDLSPLRVLSLFLQIPDSDCELLDLQGRPEDLLMRVLPVPPVCIRPSVEMEGGTGSNEDDLTMKLMQIVEINSVIKSGLGRGVQIQMLMENWDFLQIQCAMYIDSDLPGLTTLYAPSVKPMRGFVQRLKGKQGRFRGNLSGKRVDFSGRTVISPDPNLRVDEVCVPKLMATSLTYPERVTEHNLGKLRQRVLNGPTHWPGANFVTTTEGHKTFLKFGDRKRAASYLTVGDIVDRHLEDGDIVLFNRQPSLHRMSIMAHRVKVMPWRTLRFNECVCAPYNADYDGDEMNIHVPQTEEARAEAAHLMGVMDNLCTPKNGEILIAATQDFLTCAFLLTSKDAFFNRAEIAQLAAYMCDNKAKVDLPPPALVKPVELWTGKQVINLLLRPNANVQIFVNLENTAEKIYIMGRLHMCPNDGYVCFRNSELVCGRLGKGTLGGGNKSGLFQVLNSDYSPRVAAEAMNRLARLSARYIGERGFSIGIDDVTPADILTRRKAETVGSGYAESRDLIIQYQNGKLVPLPGCDAEQSLEASLTRVLNDIREGAAKVCMATLVRHNSPLIMSQCGSKGSPINIAQMVACVGQQSVGGKRAPNGFQERTLPHFPRGDKTPAGKGFVANSFYSGLTPTEFFFHTMAGREGLVDTAVKTAETGYMSRRLMKALEDLYAHYDGTVRNAAGGIVQLRYGDDGLDPVAMEGADGEPVALDRALTNVRVMSSARLANYNSDNSNGGGDASGSGKEAMDEDEDVKEEVLPLLPLELQNAIETEINHGIIKAAEDLSPRFLEHLEAFLQNLATGLREGRRRLGLGENTRSTVFSKERLMSPLGLTQWELSTFLEHVVKRYTDKRIDPGSTVGAFGAQSIGEPGTQMTLKTFHFAGVASMNVTLGVPRIKEIINASKTISTPLITVELNTKDDETAARVVKGKLEKTTLGEICKFIRSETDGAESAIRVKLSSQAISKLNLRLDAYKVAHALINNPSRMKLKEEQVRLVNRYELMVKPVVKDDYEEPKRGSVVGAGAMSGDFGNLYSTSGGGGGGGGKEAKNMPDPNVQLQVLSTYLPNIIVQGIATVERAVISSRSATPDEQSQGSGPLRYQLLVEGHDLGSVMGTPGVDGLKCRTNNIMEVQGCLGIEAARSTIMHEIKYTMSSHGMSIDERHIMLLADCMTYRGEVLGITRFGIAKMKDSVLMLASFEKTTDHLFDAALHGRVDEINGVSESIIMGIPMPTGTGMFKMLQRAKKSGMLERKPGPLVMAI